MKPIVKWAGGKTKLLKRLMSCLPADLSDRKELTYIEPFVGGGSVLLQIVHTYKNLSRIIVNDINQDLIYSYIQIKESPDKVIKTLRVYIQDFQNTPLELREQFYYRLRQEYNSADKSKRVPLFLFLNKTCFNGLYRVNSKGKFNVPFGKYIAPSFPTEENIIEWSKLLQRIEIYCIDFRRILDIVGSPAQAFFYFDPPYRPLCVDKKMFTQYNKSPFGDCEQEELKTMCDVISRKGWHFMVSNSDSQTKDGPYFDRLYANYTIHRFEATRTINVYNSNSIKAPEILITNY